MHGGAENNWSMAKTISIIIPVLNEAKTLAATLHTLQKFRAVCELVLVDGGSNDASQHIAMPLVDQVLQAPPGRARQMNVGAQEANAGILLFLHADTQLPDDAVAQIMQACSDPYAWGRFDVAFDHPHWLFMVIAFMMNRRSCLTGICTGDQGLFVTRLAFDSIGGFPEIALMEDIALSANLKKITRPYCLRTKVVTSVRRWQQHGIIKTIMTMWYLRLKYFLGTDPDALAKHYYGSK